MGVECGGVESMGNEGEGAWVWRVRSGRHRMKPSMWSRDGLKPQPETVLTCELFELWSVVDQSRGPIGNGVSPFFIGPVGP